eukprot:312190-Rhodomonas_salina.2
MEARVWSYARPTTCPVLTYAIRRLAGTVLSYAMPGTDRGAQHGVQRHVGAHSGRVHVINTPRRLRGHGGGTDSVHDGTTPLQRPTRCPEASEISGTDVRYAARRRAADLFTDGAGAGRLYAISLRACYAMPGTDVGRAVCSGPLYTARVIRVRAYYGCSGAAGDEPAQENQGRYYAPTKALRRVRYRARRRRCALVTSAVQKDQQEFDLAWYKALSSYSKPS